MTSEKEKAASLQRMLEEASEDHDGTYEHTLMTVIERALMYSRNDTIHDGEVDLLSQVVFKIFTERGEGKALDNVIHPNTIKLFEGVEINHTYKDETYD